MRLPLLALRDVTIQPGQTLPLFVGRPASRNALLAASQFGGQLFAVRQKDAKDMAASVKTLYPVGTVVEVKWVLKLPDGTLKVEIVGQWCARLVETGDAGDYVIGKVQRLDDNETAPLDMGLPTTPPQPPVERDDDIIETIAIPGFDPLGNVCVERERGGCLWLVFNFMPPSWVPEAEYKHFGRCATFDRELEAALGVPVLWDDRERFYIEHPLDDTVDRIRTFLVDFRQRNEPRA